MLLTIQLADIDFRVRVDRLDSIGNDKKWVIDYKSSLPINKPWNEERPEAPQLLLYTLLDNRINALLFIELKAGHCEPKPCRESTCQRCDFPSLCRI